MVQIRIEAELCCRSVVAVCKLRQFIRAEVAVEWIKLMGVLPRLSTSSSSVVIASRSAGSVIRSQMRSSAD